jgi:acyl transferase domain-containing protein/surfactin synthase thioesterase subunit
MKTFNASQAQESIAIIGMSCRFPKANSLAEFWELLKNGQDTIAEIPIERWDTRKYYAADAQTERKTNQQHASLLSDVHDFDPLFFNISPAEATQMSPSQKLMLELAWEAIDHSTLTLSAVKGSDTGVFMGNIWTDFEHYRKTRNAKTTLHSSLGMSSNVIANRVSFAMGLTGPSLVIDTGCSASLVALHMACQSLLTNESSMSLVGGVNHILDPERYIDLTQFGALSKKGRCSSFDATADGFVRGEGGAVLLIKKLSNAQRDGNRIYALIRATAVNNNGYNNTLAATSARSQKSLFEKVYSKTGFKPHQIHYVEAHGTGTKMGDPIEATAIGEFFGAGRKGGKLRIGSVKSNIGHTEATAGIAGLVKVVLSMQHRLLPPNPHFNEPNPDIPFGQLSLEVQKDLSPWPVEDGETFKAGVNSFGWGGTNAHAAIEEYRSDTNAEMFGHPRLFCLPVSAKSSQSLKDYARAYASIIENADEESFKNTCIAAALYKADFDYRILFSAGTKKQMLARLNNFIEDDTELKSYVRASENTKIAFVFPGQGGQWLGMGSELLSKERIFEKEILACDAAFFPFTGYSLIDQIKAYPENSRFNDISVIQPVICAIQIALAKLWMALGIQPDSVVGHSMGEIAAAHIAGALTLEDVASIICERSRLMKNVSGTGSAMVLTELSSEDAQEIADTYAGKLTVAVNNSPKSTVLAGDKGCIDAVMTKLEEKGLFCRLLKVDVASHSPQMDPLKEPLRRCLQALKPRETTIPFVSTVHSKMMQGTKLDANYWVDNLRGTVQFSAAVKQLLKTEHTIFIEVNPHPVLINTVTDCAEFERKKVITIGSLQREKPEYETMLTNLGELYSKGCPVNWQHFYGTGRLPQIALPMYPFQRERYEIEEHSGQFDRTEDLMDRHPLLGSAIHLAGSADTFYWKSVVGLDKFPYLGEHLVLGRVILPAACYIEIVLEAAAKIFSPVPVSVQALHFTDDLILESGKQTQVQVKLALDGKRKGLVSIFKKEYTETEWILLASGGIALDMEADRISDLMEPDQLRPPVYMENNYYNLLASAGFNCGSQFGRLTALHQVSRQPLPILSFVIKAEKNGLLLDGKYNIHPAMMSSFFHPLYLELTSILKEGTHLDVKFSKIDRITQPARINYNQDLWGLFVFYPMTADPANPDRWHFNSDITIFNDDNTCVMSLAGIKGAAQRRAVEISTCSIRSDGRSFTENYAAIKKDDEKQQAIEQMLREHVADVIKISPKRIRNSMTFKSLGLDSLMAIQLRNLLEKDLLIRFAVGTFWTYPSIEEYSAHVREVLATGISGNDRNILPSNTTPENWFTIPRPNPQAVLRVFCFHDAGASALLFKDWENYLNDVTTELVLLEMPGRNRRMEEAPYLNPKSFLADFISVISPFLDKPYIFLGHSMGGVLAFEITRALRRKGLGMPDALFLSSVPELSVYENKRVDIQKLSNDELALMYPHLNGIADFEIRNLFINILRADLQLLYNYEFVREEPIDIPIVAIHGIGDDRVSSMQMHGWKDQTTGAFEFFSRPGGHRYIEQDGIFIATLLEKQINSKIKRLITIHS